MSRRRQEEFIASTDTNEGGYIVGADGIWKNPARVTDLLVRSPTLKISRFAFWAALAATFYREMQMCPGVYEALIPRTPHLILDRPVADAIFALAATGDCAAVVRYIKMIP